MPNTTITTSPLASVRNVLIQAVHDTYEFEELGGMSPDEVRNWLNDIVMADILRQI
ncbi:hypothetical protein [Alicyclobacillus dauci]|uniref:Uncharacterized protein n=1 Tax=Alicyclobacillus dauci TaxID=1475485 RepID=A0ABY6Z9Z5_9BACL|nr:hypothetical protein [Alicyclobacillus dauci]WAH39508.1 hypothetical protein NZD86_24385 [Alicyclobacillus dauci]WAH39568.1 hypothetical protein NZD86_24085 [Alicyclobacillus dauci]